MRIKCATLTQISCSILCMIPLLNIANCSKGDKSWVFQKCLEGCNARKCSNLTHFISHQAPSQKLMQWTCDDECRYKCMWKTVVAFEKDGSGIPQFYGKWPFKRFYGMQEPASVLFSVLNGICHLRIFEYRKNVPSSTPMYYIWHGSAIIGLNAWFWAAIFHSRDLVLTELMDYFGAFSLVLYGFYTMMCRAMGTSPLYRPLTVFVILLSFYIQHTLYLSRGRFDYGYNMVVNISVGICSLIGWLVWCAIRVKTQRYVWKCVAVLLSVNLLVLLELGDFAPIWWVFDAHSLWHAGTVPLSWLWYSFVIDDGLYLAKQALNSSEATPTSDTSVASQTVSNTTTSESASNSETESIDTDGAKKTL